MPNWSFNQLQIEGSPKDMESFLECCLKPNPNGQKTFKFSNLIPVPEKISRTISPTSSALGKKWVNEHQVSKIRDEKIDSILADSNVENLLIPLENNTPEKCQALIKEFGTDNWYDWNLQNWGTKWDIEVDDYFVSDTRFECQFDTAWTPPTQFLHLLHEKFPNLELRLTYLLEGSEDCGVIYTDRTPQGVQIAEQQDQIRYQSICGKEVVFDYDSGEYYFVDSGLVCEDVIEINPFDE
jgi:hypothetical protein